MICRGCKNDVRRTNKTMPFYLILDKNRNGIMAVHEECWDLFVEDEARNIVIKRHLKEKGIIPTRKQLDDIPSKERLIDYLLAGKQIEWEFVVEYTAPVFDITSDGAVSYVEANKNNLFVLERSEVRWSTNWQVLN